MSRKPEPTVVFDTDNPEWTNEDFARAKAPADLPPAALRQFPNTRRGPQKAPTKRPISLRLSAEVLDHFRASGPGWQTRIDQALKAAIARKLT